MVKIKFVSPYQHTVEASEFGITFVSGETLDVDNAVAQVLIKNPYFTIVSPPLPAPAPKPVVSVVHENPGSFAGEPVAPPTAPKKEE